MEAYYSMVLDHPHWRLSRADNENVHSTIGPRIGRAFPNGYVQVRQVFGDMDLVKV